MSNQKEYATKVHKAIKQIRKDLNLKGAGWVSFNKKENITAMENASIEFGVSMDKIKQILR